MSAMAHGSKRRLYHDICGSVLLDVTLCILTDTQMSCFREACCPMEETVESNNTYQLQASHPNLTVISLYGHVP